MSICFCADASCSCVGLGAEPPPPRWRPTRPPRRRCRSRRKQQQRAPARIPGLPTGPSSSYERSQHASSKRLCSAPVHPRLSHDLQRLRVVAGGRMVVLDAVQRRLLLQAPPPSLLVEGGELGAAGTEPAPRWWIRRARQVSLQQDTTPCALLVRVEQRDRR